MFNLTVTTAHTFYVGKNGWLVHNADDGFRKLPKDYEKILKKAGIDLELLKKEVLGSNANVSRFDLFINCNGDVVVKPKNGAGPGGLLGNFADILF